SGSPAPAPQPSGPPTITITTAGFSPQEVTVTVGERVWFVNTDTRGHELWGGVDHNDRSCPEVDAAGFLLPGQSRETGVFQSPGTCHFHDHSNIGHPAFTGRIVIRAGG